MIPYTFGFTRRCPKKKNKIMIPKTLKKSIEVCLYGNFYIPLLYKLKAMNERTIKIVLSDDAKNFIKIQPLKAQQKIVYNIKKVEGGVMDKELFKDKNPLLRRQILEDNCAAVERITYTSPFSEEEMGERKTELAALEEEKKAFMQAYKDKLKPKKERKKTLLTDIKRGYEEITDECFKFMDRSTRTTGYYNGNGDLVKERPMEAQEMQKTVFEDIESTGTEG